jgi:hypothetical protein
MTSTILHSSNTIREAAACIVSTSCRARPLFARTAANSAQSKITPRPAMLMGIVHMLSSATPFGRLCEF